MGSLTASMARAFRAPVEGLQGSLASLQEAGPVMAAQRNHLEAAQQFLASLNALLAEMARTSEREPGLRTLLNLNELVQHLLPWAETSLGPGIPTRWPSHWS